MKKTVLVSLLLILSAGIFAQDYSSLMSVTLESDADYRRYEDKALEVSNYILTTSHDNNDVNRLYGMTFLILWMAGTPDYTLILDDISDKLCKPNKLSLGIYLAAMTKYMIENSNHKDNEQKVKYNTVVTFLDYCDNSRNEMKIKGAIKKGIKARNEGNLSEFISKYN